MACRRYAAQGRRRGALCAARRGIEALLCALKNSTVGEAEGNGPVSVATGRAGAIISKRRCLHWLVAGTSSYKCAF